MSALSSPNTYHLVNTAQNEQILYDHLLKAVQKESPDDILEDFCRLFIEGRGYKDAHIYSALENIVKSKQAEQTFNFFFNRCCHILINHWQMQPPSQGAIPSLVERLENLAPPRAGVSCTSNRIRQLVKNFTQADPYLKLQRIARVISNKSSGTQAVPSVGNLIHRYPYLYNHCLLSDDSSQEHQRTVRQIQARTQRRYEVNLSRYITYTVRLAQLAGSPHLSAEAERTLVPAKNPTLLSDRQLNKALKHFGGTVENGYTYKTLSQSFLDHTAHTTTYKAFKDDLYEYILGSIDPEYGKKGQFNRKLYQTLHNTLPQCDSQKLTEFLMMRTASQLLNFIVVESAQNPEHYLFVDMITNIGVTRTIGVLLKIVLISQKVKPYLEKRFSILFNHYESCNRDGVPWLVKALENLQLAFSVNFGKVDLSCLTMR